MVPGGDLQIQSSGGRWALEPDPDSGRGWEVGAVGEARAPALSAPVRGQGPGRASQLKEFTTKVLRAWGLWLQRRGCWVARADSSGMGWWWQESGQSGTQGSKATRASRKQLGASVEELGGRVPSQTEPANADLKGAAQRTPLPHHVWPAGRQSGSRGLYREKARAWA